MKKIERKIGICTFKFVLAAGLLIGLAVTVPSYAGAASESKGASTISDLGYVPGELLVRFAPKAKGIQRSTTEKMQILSSLDGATVQRNFTIVPGLSLVKLPTGQTVKDALKTFNKTDGILYAEPNYKVKASSAIFPNDPYGPKAAPVGGKQWHLHNIGQVPPEGSDDADIDAPEGWDISTGSASIVIAVIDTGVDYEHVDLEDNMWTNEAELNGDPDVDDDDNGYVDDIYGYDFCNEDADPIDDEGHGTACAGLVGAVGNNSVGVTGVCWNVKIMAVKFLDEYGGGSTSDAISSIEYANLMDARVMSNSWSGEDHSEGLEDAIKDAKANGVVFIASSGNSGGSVRYPAKYAEAIAVGATDEDDEIWDYSSHGPELDVVAPSGETNLQGNIWTTDITGNDGYNNRDPLILDYTDKMGGTSGAAPQVAGLAGLILSVNGDLTPDEVQFIMESTADDKGDPGRDDYYGWGRINNESALLEADEFPTDDELVGWWKFDEGSGDIAYDSIGDNDGRLGAQVGEDPRDPAWVGGKINGALDFDVVSGEEDYVSLSPIGALVTDTVTISAWVWAYTIDDSYDPILVQWDFSDEGYYFCLDNGKPQMWLGYHTAESPTAISTTGWHHITGTYNGLNLKIYVDDVLKDTSEEFDETGVHSDAYIGWSGTSKYFDGRIDDVRVYNYALSKLFRIKNSSDETVAWFDSVGNLCLRGSKQDEWKDPDGQVDEFIIERNNGPTVYIDDSGNLYLKGTLYPDQEVLEATGADEFRIQDSIGDDVAIIKAPGGDVYIKGKLYENPEP